MYTALCTAAHSTAAYVPRSVDVVDLPQYNTTYPNANIKAQTASDGISLSHFRVSATCILREYMIQSYKHAST